MKIDTLVSIGSIAVSSIALNFIPVGQAQAVNFIQNGGFVPSNVTQSAYLGNNLTSGGFIVDIPNWSFAAGNGSGSRNGYNFIVPDGTAFKTNMAAQGNAPYGGLSLYGGTTQTVNSPTGSGWFIAADGAFEEGAINQTVSGLTVGEKYVVKFYQAAGQQSGFTGATTDRWQVSFGNTSQLSTLINLPSEDPVTPWDLQVMQFTADAPTQLLSFLSVGTPTGLPPFALLSGVSVEAVPEPLTIIGTAIGSMAAFQIRKKLKNSSK
jgi:hypothetical protein